MRYRYALLQEVKDEAAPPLRVAALEWMSEFRAEECRDGQGGQGGAAERPAPRGQCYQKKQLWKAMSRWHPRSKAARVDLFKHILENECARRPLAFCLARHLPLLAEGYAVTRGVLFPTPL